MLATLLTTREQFHSNRLGESISVFDPQTRQRLDQLAQAFIGKGIDPTTAKNQAIAVIDKLVRREASIMAYNDCFYFIGCALLLSGIAVLFFKKVKPGGSAGVH